LLLEFFLLRFGLLLFEQFIEPLVQRLDLLLLLALDAIKILLHLLQLPLQLLDIIGFLRMDPERGQYQRGNQSGQSHHFQKFHKSSTTCARPRRYAKRFTANDKTEIQPCQGPANPGNLGKAGRRAPRRQEEVNAPRHAGARRQQTAKQKKDPKNQRRRNVRRIDVALREKADRAGACSAIVVERVMERAAGSQQAEDEKQHRQQTGERRFRDLSQIADCAVGWHGQNQSQPNEPRKSE